MSDVNDYPERLPTSDWGLTQSIAQDVFIPVTADERRGVVIELTKQYTAARATDPKDPAATEMLGDLPLTAQFNLIHHRDQIIDAELRINSLDMPATI